MIRERQPDDDESDDDTPGPDRSALLDEYWNALRGELAPDLRQQLIDRAGPGESIAMELDVLDKLHQGRCEPLADGDASPLATTWFANSRAKDVSSRPGGTGSETTLPGKDGPAAVDHPQRIGKYIVVEMLDGGGQAEVFRVIHPGLAKECALKLARRPMAMDTQAGRDALQREGRLLAHCNHPNLVQVFEMDVHEGRRFVVMEYVKGLTLQQFVARRRPNPRRAARLVIELAQAVAYLHDQGITHQDIKPQNVLIDSKGRPRLIDFGLARQNNAWCDDADGWIGGTAGYMSPEQANGLTALIGPRTDVFGLGGLLYHLLTGRALYVGSSSALVRQLAREAQPIAVSKLISGVPGSLERICLKAVARDPRQRYPTAVALARDLRRSLGRRWMAAAALIALFVTAGAMLIPRHAPRSAELNPALISSAGAPRVATPSLPIAPKIVAFEVERFLGDTLESLGEIGLSGLTFVGDGVRVTARLDSPAHCYLIALEADGEIQLCRPRNSGDPTERLTSIAYPPEISDDFPLKNSLGVHAFVLVASTRPLLSFENWEGVVGLRNNWKHFSADGVWKFDGQRIAREDSVVRGEPRENPSCPSVFKDICNYLKSRPDVETFQAIAFPVKQKK